MKTLELRKKSDTDLMKLVDELRDSVRTLNFKIASKEVKNHQLLRQTKKDIGRILTIIRERKDLKE